MGDLSRRSPDLMDYAPMLAVATSRLVEVETVSEVRHAIVSDIGYLTRACAVSLWEGPAGALRRTHADVARGAAPDEASPTGARSRRP